MFAPHEKHLLMEFLLSDLLRRHATLHDNSTASREPRRERACDTCHANKTRCSGGAQCVLCAKRGVQCTYNRGNGEGRDASVEDLPIRSQQQGQTCFNAGSDSDSGSTMLTTSNFPSTLIAEPVMQIDENQVADAHLEFNRATALEMLYNVLAAELATSPPEQHVIPRTWLSHCVASYIRGFHTRWPILHAPAINESTDSVQLIATIVCIESWLHGDAKLKGQVLRIHDHLIKQFYKEMVSPPKILEKKKNHPPWSLVVACACSIHY